MPRGLFESRTLVAVGVVAGVIALGGAASLAHPAQARARAGKSGRDRPHRVRAPRLVRPSLRPPSPSPDHAFALARPQGAKRTSAAPEPLTFSATGAPPVLASFAGLNSEDGGADPPDPDVAVGNGFVVETVNEAVRVFGTDGTTLATYSAEAFFQSTSGDVTDPSVVFDSASGRWFALVLDSGEGSVRLAVSQTGDPTGAWTVYDHAPGACADQPTLGVFSTLVVVGYGGFSLPCRSGTPRFLGGGHYVYSKADLLAGGTANLTAWDPNPAFGPILAVTQGPNPTALALTASFYLQVFTFTGVPAATANATEAIVTVVIPDIVGPLPAVQKNGTTPIDTGDDRLRGATENPADGTIWTTANDQCKPPGGESVQDCLRVIAVQSGKDVYDRDIGWMGGDLYYGRIAVDGNGNAVVVHGYSSSLTYPSVGVFALATNGGMTPSAPIGIGNEAHGYPRWGDYFGAAPDGSGGVWVVGETGTFVTGSRFDWATRIVHVGASPTPSAPPPPPPPPPRDTTRPHARALPSNGRRGKTAFLRYQASDNRGRTREVVTVYTGSKALHRIAVPMSATRSGRSYAVAWHVPTKAVPPLKFCVVAFDPAGNASAKSCARISVS